MKTLQVRIPNQLRDEADSVLSNIGLDIPTAVRLYLTRVVQTRSIPFPLEASSIRVEEVPVDAETQKEMDGIASAWKRAQK